MKYLLHLNWPEKCFRLQKGDLDFLKTLAPPKAEVVAVKSERAFLKELPTATHVVTWSFRHEWYRLAPALRVLATPSAGRELIARDAPSGVQLHFGHFHGEIISEAVVGFMLAWAHGFFAARAFESSPWPRVELSGVCHQVQGTRAGIVGYGHIGSVIGRKLEALGATVKGYRRANIAELEGDLPTLDWLILALPGDTGTADFLSKKRIGLLPRRAVVVNIGRGSAVDEEALLAALAHKKIAGAYLDVFKGEPSPFARPSDDGVRILSASRGSLPPTLIRMPHASAFAHDYLRRCFSELKDDGCL